jgi:hypothetical protein
MNFNTSIDGWVLDGAVLNLTSSMLGQPNIYLGFVNGHEKYLNGGRSYLQSNVVNAFGGTSNLLNYPYDEKLLALAAGVNNNIDVFSASGEVEVTNSAGNSTINGIVGRPGKVFRFFLRGPNTFTIANLSAGQTPGNRIQTSTNADIGPLSIPPGGFLIAVFSWKQWIDSGNGGWACVIQNVNYISSTNAATIPAANPLVFAGNAISRKGSGIFRVTATSCPFPTGAPVVITFQIFRDAVALPPIQKSSPVGPGDDSPCHQEWIDVITDFVPHVYSLQASAVSGTLSDSAGHCTITANEL